MQISGRGDSEGCVFVCVCVFVHAQTGACFKEYVCVHHIMFPQENDEDKWRNPGTFPANNPLKK